MDTLTRRILDAISSSIGNPLSINQLTERIKETYGSAYYANIYQKLQTLKNERLILIEPNGRSSNIKLNFENYLTLEMLAEMEIEKKIDFLSKRNDLLPFFTDMDKSLTENCAIRSISSINPSKNIKLNRIELFFLLRETADHLNEILELSKNMLNLQKKHNLQINNLILDKQDFFELLTSEETNPIKEAMTAKIALFCPQAFWSDIKEISEKNLIRTITPETKPQNISDTDLTYNLNRFGYKEFGSPIKLGKKFCLEYIATTMLLSDDARGKEAIAIILAKTKFKSNLLAFLSQKYQTTPKLMGILKAIQRIKAKPEIEKTIQILQTFNEQELPTDDASIKQKLELYHVL